MPRDAPPDDRLRARLAAALGRAGAPGTAIVATSGAEATFTMFHGQASVDPPRPVTPDTWFRLFSGTKLYTATAVMLLVDRGELSLDRSVQSVLPELALRHPITVRQLLSHDSGLPDTLRAFLAVHPGGEQGPSTREALARFRVNRGKPPGCGAQYRNVNFAILGEVVGRLCGAPFEAFVEREILAPLGADLAFRYDDRAAASAAVGHLRRWSPMRLALPLLLPGVSRWLVGTPTGTLLPLRPYALDTAAIGGIVGPPGAFLPLLREMLSPGDGLLRAHTKQQMLTQQSRGAAGVMSREGVGLGWKLGHVGGRTFWNHEGGGPGFCSETRLYPDVELGITVFMNLTQTAALSRTCHQICELLRESHAGGGGGSGVRS